MSAIATAAASRPAIALRGVRKAYPSPRPGSPELVLFDALDLSVAAGELVAIVGQSGAGKSSLLHLLAALDRPSAGEVWVAGQRVDTLPARQAAELRGHTLGYVWQFHYLLPEFTAEENVAMPLLARSVPRAQALARARHWLAEVGLDGRALHRSGELSGGEQQRVSLARALVGEPRVLLADEPTGDLDAHTAEAVFALIERLHRAHGLTTVFVTHAAEFAARAGRTLTLREGRLG